MKYIGLVLAVFMLCGFGMPSCATTKGNITVQINAAGNIYQADFWCKGSTMDFKLDGSKLEFHGKESDKQSFLEKGVKEGYEVVKDAVATNRSAKIAKNADISQ